MAESFEKEAIGNMIKEAEQDLDNIQMPKDAENLVVSKIEQELGRLLVTKSGIFPNHKNPQELKIIRKL